MKDPIELTDAAKRAMALQDYGRPPEIEGVQLVDLKRFTDDGGSFMELARLEHGAAASLPGFECRQVNYSEMDPGVIKAFHIHRRQTDVPEEFTAGVQVQLVHRRAPLASRLVPEGCVLSRVDIAVYSSSDG